MEEINNKFYFCLYDQRKMQEAFGYTIASFQETDLEKLQEMFPSPQDYLFNVTGIISNEFTSAFYSCSKTLEDSSIWVDTYLTDFSNTDEVYSYPISVLQSAVGNIIVLT